MKLEFEAVLMTTHEKTDEAIATASLYKADIMAREMMKGQICSQADLMKMMQLYLDAFWVFQKFRPSLSYNIHTLGKILEEQFQCQLPFSTDKHMYYSSCPAMLLHSDFGFSLRGSEKYKCSICGRPIMECDHITGEFYDNVICQRHGDRCNICGKKDCQLHQEGEIYDHVESVKIVYDLNIITFDIVEDPEMKFERITKVYFPKEEILNGLPEDEKAEFVYGKSPLYCHHCSQCQGYIPERFHELFTR